MWDKVGCQCWFWVQAESDWELGHVRAWSIRGRGEEGPYPAAIIERDADMAVVVAWADDVSFADESEKPVRRGTVSP